MKQDDDFLQFIRIIRDDEIVQSGLYPSGYWSESDADDEQTDAETSKAGSKRKTKGKAKRGRKKRAAPKARASKVSLCAHTITLTIIMSCLKGKAKS